MRLLLDTHVALWWLNDPRRLDGTARDAIADHDNAVFVSTASVWEVSIKQALGRLSVPAFAPSLRKVGIEELPMTWAHAERAGTLAQHHRDPFDRALVAQAIEEDLVLVTRDPQMHDYPVAVLPA